MINLIRIIDINWVWLYNTCIVTKTEQEMGYRVLGRTEDVYKGYGPRKGLEGPFPTAAGKIVYYDPKEGKYYDPTTDFYIDHDEALAMMAPIFQKLS